jgi:hypothetical protein
MKMSVFWGDVQCSLVHVAGTEEMRNAYKILQT